MTEHPHRTIAALASRQHGVFTLDQARRSGVSPDVLRQRTATGELERSYESVYVVRGSVDTWHRRVSEAALSVNGAVASHGTAAALWGLIDREPNGIEVTARRWRRSKRPFTVHESLDLSPRDKTYEQGLPITVPERTVVDLGASARWLVERALETGIRTGLVSLVDVDRFVGRVARRGRRGVGVIRPLLEARSRWDRVTESELEAVFVRLLADRQVELPVSQYVVRDANGDFICRADFAYPICRVLIELDSEAHHMDRLTFRKDRSKQNQTGLMGWRTLRYTWWDLMEREGSVVREIRAAISAPD